MRWITFVLIVLNLVLWLSPHELLTPASGLEVGGTLPRVASLKPEREVPSNHGREKVCVRMGWFASKKQAEAAAEGLQTRYWVESLEDELAPLHWVLIPPQPPVVAKRQFKVLVSQGVDAYVVTNGEYRNAISLGMFESRRAAEVFLEEKKSENLHVVLAKFPRNRLGYALAFEVESGQETEMIQAVEIESGVNFDLIERNVCEGVATPEKNP